MPKRKSAKKSAKKPKKQKNYEFIHFRIKESTRDKIYYSKLPTESYDEFLNKVVDFYNKERKFRKLKNHKR